MTHTQIVIMRDRDLGIEVLGDAIADLLANALEREMIAIVYSIPLRSTTRRANRRKTVFAVLTSGTIADRVRGRIERRVTLAELQYAEKHMTREQRIVSMAARGLSAGAIQRATKVKPHQIRTILRQQK